MNDRMALVNCDTCEVANNEVPCKDITLVCNQTTQTWTYTYLCDGCHRRQVFPCSNHLVSAMQNSGATTLVTQNPVLSKRPWGPPLDNVDLASFRASLNQHDHLAAYAGEPL